MDCLVPVLGWVHPTAEAAAQVYYSHDLNVYIGIRW